LNAEVLQLSGPQRQVDQETCVLWSAGHAAAPAFGAFGSALRRRLK